MQLSLGKQHLSGNVIFLGVGFLCACLFLLTKNFLFLGPLLWFSVRLTLTKQWRLLAAMGLFVGIGLATTSIQQARVTANQTRLAKLATLIGQATLSPGDYSVSDDYISGTVQVKSAAFSGPLRLEMTLSEAEQNNFAVTDKKISFAFKGELADFRLQENTHGFDQTRYYFEKGLYRKLVVDKISAVQATTTPFSVFKSIPLHLKRLFQMRLPTYLASFYQSTFLGEKDETFYEASLTFSRSGLWQFFSFSGLQFLFLLSLMRYLLLRLGVSLERADYWQLLIGLALIVLLGYKVNLVRGVLFSFVLRKQRGQNFLRHFSQLDLWTLTLIIT